MNIKILHESRGRMRFHLVRRQRLTSNQADLFAYYLSHIAGVSRARVCYRTGNAIVEYNGPKEAILHSIKEFSFQGYAVTSEELEKSEGVKNNRQNEKIVADIATHLMVGMLPKPVQIAYEAYGYYQKMTG